MIIVDIETNGLFPEVDKIWCAVAYDTKTKEMIHFYEGGDYGISAIPSYLDSKSEISMHNGIGYDLKVLKKVLGYEYKGRYIDTLLLSRVLFPDIDAEKYTDESGNERTENKRHSVNAWALRFGLHKPEHEDWSKFSLEMLHRCSEDVKIQARIYEFCIEKMKDYVNRDSRFANKFKSIFDLEHEVWKIMEDQAAYGWKFDLQKAFIACDELSEICKTTEDKLVKTLPPKVVQLSKTESGATKLFKSDGTYTEHAKKWFNGDQIKLVRGDFCKVQFEDFNLGSPTQVKDYLLKNGWEPTEYNFKRDKYNKPMRDSDGEYIKTSPKSPKTSEEWVQISDTLGNPDIALLAEYNKASHRLSQIKGFIENTREDMRIEARANTCATNTARMAHSIVVNVPKSDPKVFYGKQMRSLFIASEGRVLVGADASALEARCEAHYIYKYDKEAALELIEGDIHTKNANVWNVTRNTAKGGKYAILYGCSPSKLAKVLNITAKEAKTAYDAYWEANNASKQLKEDLEVEYEQYGYILGIDGRPLTIRYKHALLNTLLQSCGSICMKRALVIADRKLKDNGIGGNFVGNFHDEIQYECDPDIADYAGNLIVNSIREAGEYYGLNVALTGEYNIGKSWADTH